jgi:hypothetical protein
MIRVVADDGVYAGVEQHLEKPEQVGFFLADYDPASRTFHLKQWRPVLAEGYEVQTDVHVALTDETRAEMIQWGWSEQLSLVEVHSHGSWGGPVEFSGSDRYGFDEWVPHLWWRLNGRPYAALVTSGGAFEGWAWIDDPRKPEQVDELEVEGVARTATGATFEGLERLRRRTSV